MASLAVKYRPTTFEDVCGQKSIISILKRQLDVKSPSNCYLFCGSTGTGKTTLARIFANELNGGISSPIEIDAASNNGVDNVRQLIEDAYTRSLNGTYKVIILDEAHMLTTQAWNALLKIIEEPPMYTIFIFCTTDPQKIPSTIANRVMRFNLTRISNDEISKRLKFICQQENFTDYYEACDYLSKIANGGMRDAISMLEKCANYSHNISMHNVLESLGNISYETMISIINAVLDASEASIIKSVDDVYNNGGDIKVLVSQLVDFVLDLNSYCIFRDLSLTKVPTYLKNEIEYIVGGDGDALKYFNILAEKLLKLQFNLKDSTSPRATTIISLIAISRGSNV